MSAPDSRIGRLQFCEEQRVTGAAATRVQQCRPDSSPRQCCHLSFLSVSIFYIKSMHAFCGSQIHRLEHRMPRAILLYLCGSGLLLMACLFDYSSLNYKEGNEVYANSRYNLSVASIG